MIDASSGRTLSVEESARLTRRLAWYFHSLGIGAEDRIVVCAPNSIWHFIVHTAASWIHAVTVPVSPLLPYNQRQEIYELVSPALIISADGHSVDGVSALPISLVEERASETANQIPAGWEPLTCDNQTAALVFTSGTSGKMRAAQLSHVNLWWASQCFRDGFEYSPGSA
ncbi:MAG: AMP-binding protein, partial [Actinomyces sp.]|nr:AMP-binding protein [Actinomyces sp.]